MADDTGEEILAVGKVRARYQIQLPKNVNERLETALGDNVHFVEANGDIVLRTDD